MQFQLTKELLEELKNAVQASNERFLLEKITDLHPADIAEIFEEFDLEEAQYFYKLLDEETAADVLMELDEDARERFLSSFSAVEIAERFIDNLDSDDAADMLQELPEHLKDEVIASIEDVEQASDIIDLLAYEEGTAGALMAKELISVNENWTVRESMKEMRKQAEQLDFVYTVYVVDDEDIQKPVRVEVVLVFVDDTVGLLGFLAPFTFDLLFLLAKLVGLITQTGCFFEILFLDCFFFINPDGLDFLFKVFDIGRAGHGYDACPGSRFIHDINSLVWEESSGDVTL